MAPVSGPGLVAVFDYHKKKGYADLYSLHSWCGLLVFVLYFVQVRLSSTPGSELLARDRGGEGKRSQAEVCNRGAHFPGYVLKGRWLNSAFRG
jgi:hypothetical protein